MRRRFLPVPSSALVFTTVGCFAAGLAGGRAATSRLAVVWVTVSSSFREGLALAGPVAGLVALVVATRLNRRRSLLVPPAGARTGRGTVGVHLGALFTAAAASYLAGFAPAFVTAARQATWGTPDVGVLVSVFPVLATYVAAGYAVGSFLPGRVGLVAGVLVLGAMSVVGGMGGSAWWAVSPVWTYGNPGAGLHENPAMTGFRTLFFATVAVGLAELTATRVGGKTPGTGRRADAAFLAVPLLLAGVGLARPPAASLRDPDPPRVCEQVGPTRVCVHQAHSPLLPEVTTLTRQALTLVGDDYAARFREAVDQALVPRVAPDQIGLNLHLDSREDLRQQLALDLAGGLARQPACSLDTEYVTEEQSMTDGVKFWIYSHIADPSADSGFFSDEGTEGDVLRALDAAGPRQARQWLAAHADQLATCTLTLRDLP